jgi:hypothetical protein
MIITIISPPHLTSSPHRTIVGVKIISMRLVNFIRDAPYKTNRGHANDFTARGC